MARGEIPLGTKRPWYDYRGRVPDDEIVTISFDKINKPLTERKAMNILLLGGSGDGKSLILKNLWSVLHDAGFYTCYIDPKSQDSGRAKRAWHNPRIAPGMQPKGINLKHYVPAFARKQIEHISHHFSKYSLRLSQISEREHWMGLGMSKISASKVAKVINRYSSLTSKALRPHLQLMKEDEEIVSQTLNNMESVLIDLEDYDVLSREFKPLNMIKDWKDGKAIAISYNSCGETLMTFDIGMRIIQAKNYYFTHNNTTPIIFFFDDSSKYAKEFKVVPFNLAVKEIKEIGFNYRSLGVYNVMAVQSVGIIDENVAETYRVKLISGSFYAVDQLKSIGVPPKAINDLKEGLYRNKKTHTQEWLLVDEDNEVRHFYPFLPPCNHFINTYLPRQEEAVSV